MERAPFSTLRDPVDVARAYGALEVAWREIKPSIMPELFEQERGRLAYLVAAFTIVSQSEKDLVRRAVARYRDRTI